MRILTAIANLHFLVVMTTSKYLYRGLAFKLLQKDQLSVYLNTKGRFHRPGLTLQLANPRLRDNRGLSPGCVPSLSVNLTAHLKRDLTSFR